MTGYEYQRPRTPRTGPRYVATEQHARIVGAWTRKTHDAERVARTWEAAARRAEAAAKMNRARVRHLLEQLHTARESGVERHEWEHHANSMATRVAHLQEELAQERRHHAAANRDAKHWQARCREENARAQEYLEKLTTAAQGTRHPTAPQDPQAPAPVREQLVILEQRVAQLTGALGDAMVIARDAVDRARRYEQAIHKMREAHAAQEAMDLVRGHHTPHQHDDREQEQ